MTTFVYGPTPGRAWLNLMLQRDGAAYETALRLVLPLKRKGVKRG